MPKSKARENRPGMRKSPPAAADLLVEIGTEELPPKALRGLSEAFGKLFRDGLDQAGLLDDETLSPDIFGAPRRLAVRVPQVRLSQPDQTRERRGPALQAAYDDEQQPTKALVGFARSCGVTPQSLETLETDRGAWIVFRAREKGRPASELIPQILTEALKKLPVPRRMRWAGLDAEFVRPVHWVVLLHGEKVIHMELLSVKAGRTTRGHRFHHPKPITLKTPQEYESVLSKQGAVIADFAARRAKIRQAAERLAAGQGGEAAVDEALLDEVTSLVEWPEAILGSFDKAYLKLPAEVLATSMQDNQKYFPVTNKRGKLLPCFITVSNIKSKNKVKVREGNERVLHARFADARFFWETDLKTRLQDRIADLKHIVFHEKLGSVHDKAVRVGRLAGRIAQEMGGEAGHAERAALLAKADLLSGMVGEFPELQGVMGRYYASHDGEPQNIAAAIEEQYLPRFAGDRLPETALGQALAIADKLDTLLSIFGLGEFPTGDRDPYGLRRAALGVLRIMIEHKLELDVLGLLEYGADGYAGGVVEDVYAFMMERLRAYYTDAGLSGDVFEAVLACRPTRPLDFDRRIRAVTAFIKLKEAESLTAANKRIRNILRQGGSADWDHVSELLLEEEAERHLARRVAVLQNELAPLFDAGDYTRAMKHLAGLRPQVDEFFDRVMVMVDEEAVRDNRLALLNSLSRLFLRVADLSKLQG